MAKAIDTFIIGIGEVAVWPSKRAKASDKKLAPELAPELRYALSHPIGVGGGSRTPLRGKGWGTPRLEEEYQPYRIYQTA